MQEERRNPLDLEKKPVLGDFILYSKEDGEYCDLEIELNPEEFKKYQSLVEEYEKTFQLLKEECLQLDENELKQLHEKQKENLKIVKELPLPHFDYLEHSSFLDVNDLKYGKCLEVKNRVVYRDGAVSKDNKDSRSGPGGEMTPEKFKYLQDLQRLCKTELIGIEYLLKTSYLRNLKDDYDNKSKAKPKETIFLKSVDPTVAQERSAYDLQCKEKKTRDIKEIDTIKINVIPSKEKEPQEPSRKNIRTHIVPITKEPKKEEQPSLQELKLEEEQLPKDKLPPEMTRARVKKREEPKKIEQPLEIEEINYQINVIPSKEERPSKEGSSFNMDKTLLHTKEESYNPAKQDINERTCPCPCQIY